MKVAVTATGDGLDAAVDPRFGRCQRFVFVDLETMEAETVKNDNVDASGGAGIQSAQLIADKAATVVLTGNCGPHAHRTLEAAGIQVIIGVQGTVAEAIEKYKAGELLATDGPNVQAKNGVS
jgi:predicted Fe-Mo cluster-binding NifX family protein